MYANTKIEPDTLYKQEVDVIWAVISAFIDAHFKEEKVPQWGTIILDGQAKGESAALITRSQIIPEWLGVPELTQDVWYKSPEEYDRRAEQVINTFLFEYARIPRPNGFYEFDELFGEDSVLVLNATHGQFLIGNAFDDSETAKVIALATALVISELCEADEVLAASVEEVFKQAQYEKYGWRLHAIREYVSSVFNSEEPLPEVTAWGEWLAAARETGELKLFFEK